METRQPDSYASKQLPGLSAQDGSSSSRQIVLDTLKAAAWLARKGDHVQAESLLEPLCNSDNPGMEVIDLSAKIHAQQGRIEQARSLWLKALAKDPSNLHVLAALRMCAYHKRPRLERLVLQHSWVLIAIALWMVIVMAILLGLLSL